MRAEGLLPKRDGNFGLWCIRGEVRLLREAVPLPHGETMQPGLRERWAAILFLLSSNQFPNLGQSLNENEAGIVTILLEKDEIKSIAWGWKRSLHSNKGCNPQWR